MTHPGAPKWVKDTPYADTGYVGKYDGLLVWEREDGMRWSVFLKKWCTEEYGEFTGFLQALATNSKNHLEGFDIDQYEDWVNEHGPLPEGGKLIDINES